MTATVRCAVVPSTSTATAQATGENKISLMGLKGWTAGLTPVGPELYGAFNSPPAPPRIKKRGEVNMSKCVDCTNKANSPNKKYCYPHYYAHGYTGGY